MGMFEMSEDQIAEWRRMCRELVESRVNGEELIAAGGFRQGGATANYVASKAQLGVGRSYKLGEEVGAWERPALRISADRSSGMTALTIESPAEGEKATLVGISVKDDAVSQEVIGALQGAAPVGA